MSGEETAREYLAKNVPTCKLEGDWSMAEPPELDPARPVWACPMPLPIDALGPIADALRTLWGDDMALKQMGAFLVAYTPGEVCDCWTCSRELQRVIDTTPGVEWSLRLSGPLNRMIVCPGCGNKRCPRATHHDHRCTGSNEPGQPGSRYTN